MNEILNNMVFKLLDDSSHLLSKFVNCIIILLFFGILIKISRHLVKKFFNARITKEKMLDTRKAETMNGVVASILKYVLYFLALSSILVVLGLPSSSIVAVAGAGSVAIGLGAQNLIHDIVSGFFILLEDQYGVGDMVTIEGYTGTVEEVNIRTTKLRALDGTVYIVPNGNVSIVENKSKEYCKAVVDIDIDYKEDMEHVLRILTEEMAKTKDSVQGLRALPEVLGIIGLNESAVTVRIVAECEILTNFSVERHLRLLLKNRLDKENISIPFPQRTIHIVKEE